MRESILRVAVSRAQLELERHPQSLEVQMIRQAAIDALKQFELTKSSWMDYILQSRWISVGDKCSRLFFKSFKGMATELEIQQIFHGDGMLLESWFEIASTATDFFSDILGRSQDIQSGQLKEILSRLTRHLNLEQVERLNATLSLDELALAAHSLAKNKFRGPDGIPVEFFLCHWGSMGPTLLRALNDGLAQGCTHGFH